MRSSIGCGSTGPQTVRLNPSRPTAPKQLKRTALLSAAAQPSDRTHNARSHRTWRRVLNANFRLGGPEHAIALSQFASRRNAAVKMRVEALRMLAFEQLAEVGVDDEARREFRLTTSAAPTGAANANFLSRFGRDDRSHEANEPKCSFDCAFGIGPNLL